MRTFPRSLASRLVTAGFAASLSLCAAFSAPSLFAQSSVRQVKVVGSHGAVEIEVEASDRIVPQTQVLTGPDRLVVDFPNSVPGTALRNQSVNIGQVKDVRFGLFQSNPPVTRLVLDLKSAQSYQIFPSGRTVMIKIVGGATDAAVVEASAQPTQPGLVNANYTAAVERNAPNSQPSNSAALNRPRNMSLTNSQPKAAQPRAAQPKIAALNATQPNGAQTKPTLEVSFRNGLLSIKANKATFSEVLFAIQQRTGADIAIPAGAEQERIVAEIGPGEPQEVLASLLNGSNFNFLILNSATDPRQLDRVILTPRTGGSYVPSPASASGAPTPAEVSDNDPQEMQLPERPPQPAVAVVGQPPAAVAPPMTTPAPVEDDAPVNQ